MLIRDYQWLLQGRKPIASIAVRPFPIGSVNFWTEVPLSVFSGSVMFFGEDICVPFHSLDSGDKLISGYWVFGSYSQGSYLFSKFVFLSDDNFVVLPYGADLVLANPSFPVQQGIAPNALTVESVLARNRELHLILGSDHDDRVLELVVQNFVNSLTAQLWLGDYLIWSNQGMVSGQGYNTALGYTPIRFAVVFGERVNDFQLASSFWYGTTIVSGSVEQAILIAGLTEAPIFLTFPHWFQRMMFGSIWIQTILGLHSLDESWFRLWAHRPRSHFSSLSFPAPFPEATWITSHTKVFGAELSRSFGTLIIDWLSTGSLPIISDLVVGTTVYFNATQFVFQAPIKHVSYSAELTADAISSSGRIELTPFRITDWTNYAWVAYPLSQYIVAIPELGTLYVGARVSHSVVTERVSVETSIETADNQALLKRMTVDSPVTYDYWDSERAAKDFLNRFGLAFVRHQAAANMPLMPEFYGERRTNYAWTPRLGELALDFFNRIAQLNGWRVDWTEFGTVRAYPKWDVIGSTWVAYWPTPDIALSIADLLVSRLNVNVSDYERRNILILYGVDAFTNYDVVKIFADIESFAVPWSDRFMPVAVPAFVRFDKPIPEAWMDYLGEWLSKRLFITPFEIQFTMPLFLRIRPGDEIVFANANPMNFHRYRFLVTRVQHEIGREYSTVVTAHAYKEVST